MPVIFNLPNLDLGRVVEPVTKLIEVVASGIGTIYEPLGTVLQAKADARAQVTLAEAEAKSQMILRRAAIRITHVETRRQLNIEKVVEAARKELPQTVSPTPVDQDWINHFFTSVQDVSSEDLQKIWGRILAGEVASPGKFSWRTVEFLKTISKQEAEMFSAILSVCFTDTNGWHLYFETPATYRTLEKQFGKIAIEAHFIDIGILATEVTSFRPLQITGSELSYDGQPFVLSGPPKPANARLAGIELLEDWFTLRRLTALGQELARVVECKRDRSLVGAISAELTKEYQVSIVPTPS